MVPPPVSTAMLLDEKNFLVHDLLLSKDTDRMFWYGWR